jgi:hypothetical protein
MSSLDERRQTLAVAVLVALTCALYSAGRSVIQYLGYNQHPSPHPGWFSNLPIWYFLQSAHHKTQFSQPAVASLQVIALLQFLALLGLYLVLYRVSPGRWSRVLIGVGATAMLAMAMSASVMSSSDLYFYVGSALAVPSAYSPGAMPFSGEQHVVNQIWGLPLLPSGYGPLWIALSKLAVSTQSSLIGQLFALRLLEACALAICAALLFVLTRSVAIVAIVVLNPALYELYVVDGHNDLIAVAFVLAAAVFRKRLWIAIPFAAAAGLIKLPFALIGMLAFCGELRLIHRLSSAIVAACLCILASLAFAGPEYVRAMRVLYVAYERPTPLLFNLEHVLVAVACVVAVVLALVSRRFFAAASWSFVALGQEVMPWYLAWGFPYASLANTPAIAFFVTMPIANVLLSTDFPTSPIIRALRFVAIGVALYAALVQVRIRREAAAIP